MKKEQLQELKQLEKNEEKLQEKLVEWLKEEVITVDDLLSCCKENKVNIPASCITVIGLMYSGGKDGITKNTSLAFKLYKFAADELAYGSAYGNCALYYFDGRSDKKDKNLDQAYAYCKKAIDLKADKHLLMARILLKRGDYVAAVQSLKNVKDSKQKEKSAVLFKECLIAHLKHLYKKLDLDEQIEDVISEELQVTSLSSQESNDTAKDVKGLPGWFKISELLDGFDIDACDELATQIELVDLQLKIADAATELAKKQLESARERKLSTEIIKVLEKKERELIKDYQALSSKKEELVEAYQKYTNSTDRAIHRQYQTELRFFDPRRTTKEKTRELALELEKRRLSDSSLESLEVTGTPARRLITAERSTIESSVEVLDLYNHANYHGYINDIGWISNPKAKQSGSGYQSTYTKEFTFDEKVKLGESEIEYHQRTNPHVNHLGDFYNTNLGNYSAIVTKFHEITGTTSEAIASENEQKLAQYMLNFCHDGKPLKLQKLKLVKDSATEEDVHELNKIFYHCFIKEVASWMLPRDESHKLPLATVQIRALKLIIKGYLTIQEVFGKDAPYGVYTGSDIGKDENIPKLCKKIININILYDKVVLEHHTDNFAAYVQFFKEHPSGKILPTRKELHHELKEAFGGSDNETDGEGYETDEEKETLYQTIMNNKV